MNEIRILIRYFAPLSLVSDAAYSRFPIVFKKLQIDTDLNPIYNNYVHNLVYLNWNDNVIGREADGCPKEAD